MSVVVLWWPAQAERVFADGPWHGDPSGNDAKVLGRTPTQKTDNWLEARQRTCLETSSVTLFGYKWFANMRNAKMESGDAI